MQSFRGRLVVDEGHWLRLRPSIPGRQTTDVTGPLRESLSQANSSWRTRTRGDTPERDCPSVCAAVRSCPEAPAAHAEPLLHEREDIIGNDLGHAGPTITRGRPRPSRAGQQGRVSSAPVTSRFFLRTLGVLLSPAYPAPGIGQPGESSPIRRRTWASQTNP